MNTWQNCIIANRDASGQFKLPEDGWYHLAPKGEYAHPESGLIQVIDDPALAAMANRFGLDSKVPHFPGLLVDFDHFSYDPEKSSEAAGWIMALENRADLPGEKGQTGGLWAQIRWSDEGQAALERGRYRLISPVWLPKDVAKLDNARIRPLRLDSAGLTNNPNLKGMVPLSNRQTGMSASPDFATAGAAADSQIITQNKNMKTIATKLGLSAEASEETILAEVTKLQNRAEAAEAALAPLTNRAIEAANKVLALENQNAELLAAQIETDLDKYSNRFKPDARAAWKKNLLANRVGTIELLESLPLPAAEAEAPMHNRAAAKTPGGEPGQNRFAVAVAAEMKAGKTKVQAVQAVMNRDPGAYSDWLENGGQAHL
jgi:phage I-like protein